MINSGLYHLIPFLYDLFQYFKGKFSLYRPNICLIITDGMDVLRTEFNIMDLRLLCLKGLDSNVSPYLVSGNLALELLHI